MADDADRYDRIQTLFKAAHRKQGASESTNQEMVNRKEAGFSGSLSLASGRPRDPMWYWRQANLPYDIWNDPSGAEMARVREFARLLYVTHPLLGSAVDIYSKYPLSGMEVVCPKDKAIARFHTDLFMDDLNYEEYLTDVGREYWLVGEAFPLGSFNDLAGAWDSDDLMLPEDVNVVKTPFSNQPRFEMALPWNIRQILNRREPRLEYLQLIENYPEFLAYNFSDWQPLSADRFMIPVSDGLMQQVMRKGDSFHSRGVPILMRAFRAVAQEEMLLAASDSISQRLYTPLILARIGASAQDLGTDTPWIPTQADLDDFVEDVNAALAADFRLIVTHFAANLSNVFGRESMPDLSRDFDRLEERMLQAFGMSKTMISGASGGDTYAADALNRDLVTQLLAEFQRKMRRFFRRRAEIVAEAQGHYDYERKGGRAVPIMEKVMDVDPETGDVKFVDRPKLLLPELRIKAMNMRDEKQSNDLLAQLRGEGVPISQKTRMVNVPIDLEEEMDAVVEEQVEQAVVAQRVRRRTFERLRAEGLPIPEDLVADFQPKILEAQTTTMTPRPLPGDPIPTLGTQDPADTTALVPEPGADAELQRRNRAAEGDPGQPHRPPESDEQRAGMPKAAAFEQVMESLGVNPAVLSYVAVTQRHEAAQSHEGSDEQGMLDGAPTQDGASRSQSILPIVGSYKLRHRGQRSADFFFLKEGADESDPTVKQLRAQGALDVEFATEGLFD